MPSAHVVLTTKRLGAGTKMFEDQQAQLREYLRVKKVPRDLNRRISHYFRFCYERSFYKESTILSFLSGQLRGEVLLHKSRRLLETVEIFADLPPVRAIRLASCMKEHVVLDNEVVVRVGTLEDRMYYILTGTLAVYNRKGFEMLHLGEGDHFGEAALLSDGVKWTLSIVALETTRMWTLSRDAFKFALSPDQEYLDHVDEVARARHGLLPQELGSGFRAEPLSQFVQHLRRVQRSAKFERRNRERLESRYRSFLEHDAEPGQRVTPPFARARSGAKKDAPMSTSFRRSSALT